MDNSTTPAATKRRNFGRLNALLACILVVALALLWLTWPDPSGRDSKPAVADNGTYSTGSVPSQTQTDAVAAATRAIQVILAYDYRHLAENKAATVKLLSPHFATTFTSTFDKAVGTDAKSQRAITRALVRGSGAISETDGGKTVRCLVFVDQLLVRNSAQKEAATTQVGQSRVVVTMVHKGNSWLVDEVTPF